MGVGMPQGLLLNEFGEHVRAAFGEMAYRVGSSLMQKDGWRDVDVRVLIDDAVYAELYGDPDQAHWSAAWRATVLAWSSFGRTLTGLPIDFQIQPRKWANEKFSGQRSALCTVNRPTPGKE